MIYDHYIIVCKWELDFDPEENEIEKVVVWIHLLGLPIMLYDKKIS